MKKLLLAMVSLFGIGSGNANAPLDFSNIDSREKAAQLAQEGKLFKILLFPAEFGGDDASHNIVYVPAGIPEIKDQITETLIRLVEDGLIDNLQVLPEYKGNSFVPARILMKTSHSGKAGQFNPSIEVW